MKFVELEVYPWQGWIEEDRAGDERGRWGIKIECEACRGGGLERYLDFGRRGDVQEGWSLGGDLEL